MESTWADERRRARERKAQERGDDSKLPAHFPAGVIADETFRVARDHERVSDHPASARGEQQERPWQRHARETRCACRENEGAISFVRLDREISYTTVPRILPGGVLTPDRYIGIEMSFSPDLDEYFGVRHVKRGVEPHG